MNETDEPIVVGSPAHEQLGQAMRVFLTAVGGYMAGKGWIDAGLASATIPLLLIAGPLAWGQFRVLKSNAQRKTMANALPDSIASTKP